MAIANPNNGVEQNHNSLVDQCWGFLKEHKAVSGIVAAGAVAGIALLTHKFAFARAAVIAEDTLGSVGCELGATARTSEAVGPLATRINWGAEIPTADNPPFGLVSLGGSVSEKYLAWLGTKLPEVPIIQVPTPLSQSIELGRTLTEADLASLGLKSPGPEILPISTPDQFDYAITRAFEPGAVRLPSRSIGL